MFRNFFKKRPTLLLTIEQSIKLDMYYNVRYINELTLHLKKDFHATARYTLYGEYGVIITFDEDKYKTFFILKHL